MSPAPVACLRLPAGGWPRHGTDQQRIQKCVRRSAFYNTDEQNANRTLTGVSSIENQGATSRRQESFVSQSDHLYIELHMTTNRAYFGRHRAYATAQTRRVGCAGFIAMLTRTI